MRFSIKFVLLTLDLLATQVAILTPPCSGAPMRPLVERSSLRHASPANSAAVAQPAAHGVEATSAAPDFQAVGFGGDLAVVDPDHLNTPAIFIQPDAGFSNVEGITGLASHPATGKIFIAGNDGVANSYLGTVDFNTGQVTTVGKIAGRIVVDITFDGTGNLFALTSNGAGNDEHSLLSIDTGTAAASVVMVLDPHGEASCRLTSATDVCFEAGAIAFNPTDGNFYYADRDDEFHTFVDRIAPGTFTQTSVLTSDIIDAPTAMAFAQGKLWLSTLSAFLSADAANIGAGFDAATSVPTFSTSDGTFFLTPDGMFPIALPCVPTPTAACLFNRFKVEIAYDATPGNGAGPANVVLESSQSVKFTFFDPQNVEVILKTINACTLNNKWWVFAGGLTNVGVTITVTDTVTHAVQIYKSQKTHLFQTFADTSAFPCP
jgi:hypothetical protein